MKRMNFKLMHAPTVQHGQAAAEAILTVALLSIISVGIAWVAQLQHEALAAAQTSRQAAFGEARGQASMGTRGLPGVLSAAYGKSSSNVLPISKNKQAQTLANDWLALKPETLTVWAQAGRRHFLSFFSGGTLRLSSMVDSSLGVRRQTSLITGAGHATSDANTQQRLATSATGWLSAASLSMQAAKQEKSRMQPVDAVWKRGVLTSDWLRPWADLVPAERIGAKRR